MKTIITVTPFSAGVGGGGRGVTPTNIPLRNPEQNESDQALAYSPEYQIF